MKKQPIKKDRDKYLTTEEFDGLLNAASGDMEAFMLFYLGGNLGLRVGELVRLRWVDVNIKDRCISIPSLKQNVTRSGTRQGSIKRGVLPTWYVDMPVSDDILRVIGQYRDYLKENKLKVNQWLFTSRRDELHMPKFRAQLKFKYYAKKAGLRENHSIHALRHYKGTSVYITSHDIYKVKALLRHRHIAASDFYTHLDLEEKRKIADEMPVVGSDKIPVKKWGKA